MSEHLEKAKSALSAASDVAGVLDGMEEGNGTPSKVEQERHLARLMDIAAVQASVAMADALTRMADRITRSRPSQDHDDQHHVR